MNCADADILLEKAGIDKDLDGYQIIDRINRHIENKQLYKDEHMIKALHYKKFSEQIKAMANDEAINYGKHLISQDPGVDFNVRGIETDFLAFYVRAHEKLNFFMERARPTMFGFKNMNDVHDDFIRAFDATNKDPKMKEFFELYMDIKDEFRTRYYNAVGEDLGIRKGVDHPQMNDPVKISKVEPETWYKDLLDWLDLDEMRITSDKLREFLVIDGERKSRHRIISRNFEQAIQGAHDSDSIGRYRNKRFFIFKDSDSWLKYQKKYGSESIYASLNDDILQMSKEIALVERFGPNPSEMFKTVLNMIADKTDEKNWIRLPTLDYGYFTGSLHIPHSEKLALYGSNFRNATSAILLGSANIISVGDIAVSAINLKSNGFSVNRALAISTKNLFRNFIDRKRSSIESGAVFAGMNHALDTMHATSRVVEIEGSGFLAKLAHSVPSISGLGVMTTASKVGGNAIMHTQLAEGNWNALNKKMLDRYGITDKDIKVFKEAGTHVDNYGRLMPNYEKMEPNIAEAFIGAVKFEGLKGTLETTVRNKSLMKQGVQTGTVIGELLPVVAQFAQFTTQMFIGPLKYGFSKKGLDRINHLGSLIGATTIIASFAIQVKELNAGRELYEWDDGELWLKALIQGGSLSFMGDILFADRDFGRSVWDILPAPGISLLEKYLWTGIMGDMSAFKDKGYEQGFKDLLKTSGIIIEDINPLKRLWWTRLIVRKYLGETILRATNPNFDIEKSIRDRKKQNENNK